MPLISALRRQRQVNFRVQGQPGLQSEFQNSQGYTEKPCLEKPKKQNKTKKKRMGSGMEGNYRSRRKKKALEMLWVPGRAGPPAEENFRSREV